MTKTENDILNFIRKNSTYLFLAGVTVFGLLVRFYWLDYMSGDAKFYLLPWYSTIQSKGISGLGEQVGNYNILYQFIIYILTLVPVKPLYAYKLLSVFFDFALAAAAALIVDIDAPGRLIDKIKSERFAEVYAAVVICPVVFLNSACWAQCDSIYVFFVFASLYAYLKEKYALMFVLYGLAFAFKLQAVFVLPFLLILYAAERKFSVIHSLLAPLTFMAAALPGLLMGRSLSDPVLIYVSQTGKYNHVSMNYGSFWNCVIKTWSTGNTDYADFKMAAVSFTVLLLCWLFFRVLKSEADMSVYRLICLLHISVYTCVLFLPTMHERYGYIYEITAIMLMFFNKKFFFPGIGVLLLSCMTYGWFLFVLPYSPLHISLLNVCLYIWYVYNIVSEQFTAGKKGTPNEIPLTERSSDIRTI